MYSYHRGPNPPPYPGPGYRSPKPPRPYSNTIFLVLCAAYLMFLISIFIDLANAPNKVTIFFGNLGISLLWGTLVSVLVIDWRGFFSLNGVFKWRSLTGGKRIALGILYLSMFPFLLGIYLVSVFFVYQPPSIQTSTSIGQGKITLPLQRSQIGIIVGTVVTLLALIVYMTGNPDGNGLGNMNAQSATPTPTANTAFVKSSMTTQSSSLPTATLKSQSTTPTSIPQTPTPVPPTPTQVPSPTPTPIPPTPTPIPAPTQAPQSTQASVHTGVNGNPWGYDFNPGNLIYSPPATFCDYFNCIASFWKNTNGYVDECNDGNFSHSGGVSGACSRHGGEMRPLYSH